VNGLEATCMQNSSGLAVAASRRSIQSILRVPTIATEGSVCSSVGVTTKSCSSQLRKRGSSTLRPRHCIFNATSLDIACRFPTKSRIKLVDQICEGIPRLQHEDGNGKVWPKKGHLEGSGPTTQAPASGDPTCSR
jgi:hypothetical protein